jgi:AraC-like DNA-binding protein
VELAHPAPRHDVEYRRVFGTQVFFLQPRNALLVSPEMMQRRSSFSNPETLRTLRAEADRRLAELSGPSWIVRVRGALQAGLPDGRASLAAIAQRLGVAPRTLQRHLTEERIGFQQLVDEVREVRARELVDSGEITIAEISRQLGFADPRSFHCAFHRWMSLTPSAYRSRVVQREVRSGR